MQMCTHGFPSSSLLHHPLLISRRMPRRERGPILLRLRITYAKTRVRLTDCEEKKRHQRLWSDVRAADATANGSHPVVKHVSACISQHHADDDVGEVMTMKREVKTGLLPSGKQVVGDDL